MTTKTAELHLRINPQLKEFLAKEARESDKTLNDFCNDILRNRKNIKTIVAAEKSNDEVKRLFAAMGNNINQLARHCNSTGEAATPKQLLQILQEAKEMQREILKAITEQANGNL